jgi:hypothetical protein
MNGNGIIISSTTEENFGKKAPKNILGNPIIKEGKN